MNKTQKETKTKNLIEYVKYHIFEQGRKIRRHDWPSQLYTAQFDSSVGRALHRYRRGHGFDSRSGLTSGLNFTTAEAVYRAWMIHHVSKQPKILVLHNKM